MTVEAVDPDGLTLTDGDVIGCSTVVWCAGVAANPLIATTGLPLSRGRLVVTPQLSVHEHPEVFAIRDAAAVPDITSKASPAAICPPTAQHAMRQGPAAARNIVASIRGRTLRPYRHRDLGLGGRPRRNAGCRPTSRCSRQRLASQSARVGAITSSLHCRPRADGLRS